MSTQLYRQIRDQLDQLTPDEQIQLMEDLLALYRRQVTAKPLHDIMEFRGIAKDLWKDVDVQKYLDEERNSWGG
jgi:uncharacterized protein (UPF0305 family)